MKKLRCPRCGAINLERFVTYPHCAACGALLGEEAHREAPPPFWQRRLRVGWWASLLGLVVVLLVGAAGIWQVVPRKMGQLVVYVQVARRVRAGQLLPMKLTVDTVANPDFIGRGPLREVSLRLERAFLRRFALVNLQPPPDDVRILGDGQYFIFNALERESDIRLIFRPRGPGSFKLRASVQAMGQEPFNYISQAIRVVPASALPAPGPTPASLSALRPPTAKSQSGRPALERRSR